MRRKKIQINCTCKWCGKEFLRRPCDFHENNFCSRKCCDKGKFRKPRKMIERKCQICGKIFTVKPDVIKKINGGKFCSLSCKGKSRTGKIFTSIEKICEICNKKFHVKPSSMKQKYQRGRFCSGECYGIWRSMYLVKEKNSAWLGGISFEPYGLEFNKQLKEQIRERDNYVCQECGFHQGLLKKKLNIHHVDYNKKNNNPENLISLCSSCHMQTGFKREDWTEYFSKKLS